MQTTRGVDAPRGIALRWVATSAKRWIALPLDGGFSQPYLARSRAKRHWNLLKDKPRNLLIAWARAESEATRRMPDHDGWGTR